jgi:hypothetical protein
MVDDILKIRVTADFKEAEGAFLKLAKVATSFESTIKGIAGNLNRDFNRINGMAELFGDTSNVVKDKMEALKKAMSSLMTNGFQALNPEVQKLKAQYDALGATLTPIAPKIKEVQKQASNAGDGIKKSNQQWTNFALVIQDLPYGFRGIQNNLPALMGGIAGMAGPLYFVGSAIIALFTAWDQGSFKAKNAIDRVAEAHKKSTEGLTKGADAQSAALVEISKMSVIFSGVKDGVITAKDALEEYNTTYGETWGIATNVNEAEDNFIKKSNAYVQAMALRAMANEKYAQAQEAFKTGALARGEDQTSFLQKFAAGLSALDQVGVMTFDAASLNKWAKSFSKTYADTQNVLVKDIQNESASSFDKLMAQGREFDKQANKKLKDAGIKTTTGKKGLITKEKKLKEDPNYYTKIIEQEQKVFTDSLDNELKYADDNSNKKVEILQRYTSELNYWHELGFIQESFYLNKSADLHKQLYDTKKTLAEQDSKEQNIINERNLQNSLDVLKIQSDVETKLLLKGGKSTSAERIKILEDYKNKLYDLASIGGYTAEQFDKIDDALLRVDAAIAGSKDKLKDFNVSLIDLSNQANEIITNLGRDLVAKLAENIGKALAGEKTDLFGGFIDMISDAAIGIGKALIAYGIAIQAFDFAISNPLAAVAAGIGLVIAGNFLKSKFGEQSNAKNKKGGATAFANGGIVSGPTMGLIGEYPGAKSNPEVVAPLDKLKDMIGVGGGQFVLRGSDLVLALNRSESSLNLRRGA